MAQPSENETVTPHKGAMPLAGEEVILLAPSVDANLVNWFVNHPDNRPYSGGEGYIDLAPAVARPENWFLVGEHGGFALIWSAPGVYEIHVFIMKSGRGRWAHKAGFEVVEFASEIGAFMLWARIPPKSRHVAIFAAAHDMAACGEVIDTFGEPCRVYVRGVAPCLQQQ